MRMLVTFGSVRRLARQWVDLKPEKRRELLDTLDEKSRLLVLERMTEIRVERKKRGKQDVS